LIVLLLMPSRVSCLPPSGHLWYCTLFIYSLVSVFLSEWSQVQHAHSFNHLLIPSFNPWKYMYLSAIFTLISDLTFLKGHFTHLHEALYL